MTTLHNSFQTLLSIYEKNCESKSLQNWRQNQNKQQYYGSNIKLWSQPEVNILKIIMKSLHMLHLRSKFLLIIIIQWKTLKIVKKMILNPYEDEK